jgi:hypothetical protein
MKLDDDLRTMDPEALIAEVKRLRFGIRKHRDSSGHELCWHHPDLWRSFPNRTTDGGPRADPAAAASGLPRPAKTQARGAMWCGKETAPVR